MSSSERRALVTIGDPAGFKQFLEENADALQAEVTQRKQAAKDKLREVDSAIPYSNAEWLAWMEKNSELWEETLRTCTSRRRVIAQRVEQAEPLPQAPRLGPKRAIAHMSDWLCKLIQGGTGFRIIRAQGATVAMFVCFMPAHCWGLVLEREPGGNGNIEYPVDTPFCDQLQPLEDIVALAPAFEHPDDVKVFEVDVEVCSIDALCITWTVKLAREVQLEPKTRRSLNTMLMA